MKNKNKLIQIIITILLILGIGILIFKVVNKEVDVNKLGLINIKPDEVKFYQLVQDNSFGVIDDKGNEIIKPAYKYVQIPNPTKDIFILYQKDNVGKAFNREAKPLFEGYDAVEAIEMNQSDNYVPYEKTVLKYKKGNNYGLLSIDGKEITKPIYEDIQALNFKEGYLKVKRQGRYGVIDIQGTPILKEEYDNIYADGYISDKMKVDKTKYEGYVLRVKTDDGYRFGYANYKGKKILDPIYTQVNRITEIKNDKDAYLVVGEAGKYGLMKNNKKIIPIEFQDMKYNINTKVIVMQKMNSYGVFNLEGKTILPVDYDSISIIDTYIDAIKQDKRVVYDTKGNLLNTKYISYKKVKDNYAIVVDQDNNYNIIDSKNNEILKEKYMYLEYYTNDLFIASNEKFSGIININGNVVIPFNYNIIQKIEGTNILIAEDSNKNIGLINQGGKYIPGLNSAILVKEDDYIKIINDTDVKYFNNEGFEVQYKDLYPNNKLYAFKENGKWGYKNKEGKVEVSPIYEMVTESNNGSYGIKKDGKWGVMNDNKQMTQDFVYKLSDLDVKFLNKYYTLNNPKKMDVYSHTILKKQINYENKDKKE